MHLAMSFDDFGLDPNILRALGDLGFEKPTPIQTAAIETLLSGKDVIASARTGSGKTAAFGLPLLQRIKDTPKGVRALVLAPTRELALQVSSAIQDFAKYMGIRVLTVYGGSAYGPQLAGLRAGAQVVVGTPGRLIDLLARERLDLSNVDMVVLDEADEMLRMGFIDDVETLLSATPEERQVCLFSATMPHRIQGIARKFLKNAENIQVERSAVAVDHIQQRWIRVPQQHKLEALIRVLRTEVRGTTLVFAATKVGCANIADSLVSEGFAADALHGDLDQNARERVVHRLRTKRLELVVATDVAARGIDIDHLTHVINLDLPLGAEPYVHRIGRTGRAGATGNAISFVTPRERTRLFSMQNRLKIRMDEGTVPSDADISKKRRDELKESLASAAERDAEGHAAALVAELCESGDFTPETLAAAAMRIIGEKRGIRFGETADTNPPWWSQPVQRKVVSPDMAGGVELFLAIGREAGVMPGDIVGALTNGAGIPGASLGKISISARSSFVTVAADTADEIVAACPSIVIRGQEVKVKKARPRPPMPPRSGRPGPRSGPGRSGPPGRPGPGGGGGGGGGGAP
ncbi:MAG: ATP-dependent RNA helicase DeaD, partial [Myxococcota bacterium]